MKVGLWVAQVAMGLFFLYVGVLHFIVPDGLPETFAWMYDLSDTLHIVSGTAEILGGLGLILPAVTRIQPQLVPLAGLGLALVMVGAIVYHIGREEYANIGSNALWAAIGLFIAWGRWTRHPIEPRST